jgi:hypothetical protein
MTDFEDSNSPKWDNQIQGQVNLYKAIRRELSFKNEAGKEYKLNDKIATLQIRPRGWHLDESTSPLMASASPAASSTSAWSSSTTPRSRSPAAPAPSSTCRRWKATSKPACGTTSS